MDGQTNESSRVLRGVAGNPGDGPYQVLEMDIDGDRIVATRFDSNGCASARRAAGGLAGFLVGRTLDQASRIEPSDLEVILGPLPDGHAHHYARAIDALNSALRSRQT